jgi:hypothetical protein
VVTACEKPSEPIEAPTYRLTATITEDNRCTVNVLGKTYNSAGMVRGDVPAQFIGTVADKSYHGFGCWVKTEDGDGDLVVLFAGNHLGQPLDVGTYPPKLEILDQTPLHTAAVNFRASEFAGGEKLRTKDNSSGDIRVEEAPGGGRRVIIDVDLVRWRTIF